MVLPPPQVPLVLIGPGAGCAIFRSFLRERLFEVRSGSEHQTSPLGLMSIGTPVAPSVFFFGCRHESTDYYYREEWEEMVREGVLSHLFVAFSRDNVGDQGESKKRYVQNVIREQTVRLLRISRLFFLPLFLNYKEVVWNAVAKGGVICLSGYLIAGIFFSPHAAGVEKRCRKL